ncbi:DMT family transporter [Microlunatus sp. Gsoil 973]|uniref:DMT family transporter n=1 Tax=Microlunatus sp. Gsoil 973 TaxID=2672569 RepID=UPI0012B4AD49|nr:DMT family transporter [Microlunatus sp. Gsoil 973]QGN31721.1 hypothetical protein GJV80_01555 [Microlunatus sp. Gsoil 973]
MGTALAITLAVIDSTCFAAAAVYQQRAVRRTAGHRLTLRGLIALPAQPGWVGGVGLAAIGVTLHVVALILAPVTVVQPIGVLGVPIAVLLAARLAGKRPSATTAVPILLCVAGIGGFILLTATHVGAEQAAPLSLLLVAEAIVIGVMVLALRAARRLQGWSRCLVNAVAGAFGVGMVAALMRALVQHIGTDAGRLLDLTSLALLGLMAISGALGGWLVQQAYSSGPAEVVLASLTVVDPMIAVIVGLVVLGEGARLSPTMLMVMITFGLLAAVGVVALAKTHPEVALRNRADPEAVAEGRGRSERIVERVW